MQEQEGRAGPGGGFLPMQGFCRGEDIVMGGAGEGICGCSCSYEGLLAAAWAGITLLSLLLGVDQPGYAQLLPRHEPSENRVNMTFRGVYGTALSWRKLQAFGAEIAMASQLNKTWLEMGRIARQRSSSDMLSYASRIYLHREAHAD